MKQIILTGFIMLACLAHAQQIHLSGFVSDAHNGESVIGANVYLEDRSVGVATDTKGYYNLVVRLPVQLCVSCVGYEDTCFSVESLETSPLHIRLQPAIETLEAVEVKAEKIERRPFNILSLNSKSIDELPSIGSRPDIFKVAQQLPGVEAATEASSLMVVRGGNPGENLYLLDNVPLIYVNHLGGFMSVFNAEMINSMEIYKGGFPARFGGKLSSVVDLTTKKGDPSRLRGSVSVGLTDVAFAVEGPGGLSNSSFMVTGRKTLTEAFLYASSEVAKLSGGQDYDIIYGFYDINAKYTWTPDTKNSFSFNVYDGDDYLRIWKNRREKQDIERTRVGYAWGNLLVSGQWNSAVNSRLFVVNTLSFTQYRLKNKLNAYAANSVDTADYFLNASSSVGDISFRSDWKLFIANVWTVECGLKTSYLKFRPNLFSSSLSTQVVPAASGVVDNTLYLENKVRCGSWINGSIGLCVNQYVNGDYRHWAWEPRFNLNVNLGRSTINFSAMQVAQNSHQLMTQGAIMNNEIWIPADLRIKPATSKQVSVGWQRGFLNDHIHIETDAYYKIMEDLSTYKEGYNTLIGDSDWHNKVQVGGNGKSYGFELMTRFHFNQFDGYLGYTYSHATRQFDQINNGKEYVFEFDRPNSINFNINCRLTERWSMSALWTYQTGLPYTPAVGVQIVPIISSEGDVHFEQANLYGERNSERMRDYHRLDFAAKYKTKTKHGRNAEWTFSIYNVYCRQNPYYYYYGDKKGDPISWNQYPDEPQCLWQRSFFPLIPSFSYKVWF